MASPPQATHEPWNNDDTEQPVLASPSALLAAANNGSHLDDPLAHNPDTTNYSREPSVPDDSNKSDSRTPVREKQIKPNKVYVGGLPEETRFEDLQSCFGKLGNIVNIELKVGYGFVEFDNRQSAEDAVNKYHDGNFMGNKIKVELSHGGGRTAKYTNEPGACFKCGSHGHWARECPHSGSGTNPRGSRAGPTPDREREYHPRESRGDYAPRDYRRFSPPPPPPPRDYRDFPPPPPRVRDYDDYRRGPPPPPMPPADRYGPPVGRYGPPPPDFYRYGPPPPMAPYDRYDRRPPPPVDRLPSGYPPPGRMRSPSRFRDDYERPPPPPRDYPDYRGRPLSPPMPPPPRHYDYPPRMGIPEPPRYR